MTDNAETAALHGCRVLVVEDRILIATKLAQILKRAGCIVVGPAPSLADGLILTRREHSALGAAVLDIDLRGEEVYPLADVLRASGVPLLFLTGYGPLAIPPSWRRAPRIEKPFEAAALLRMLTAMAAGKTDQWSGSTRQDGKFSPTIHRAWTAIRHSRNLVAESQILGGGGPHE